MFAPKEKARAEAGLVAPNEPRRRAGFCYELVGLSFFGRRVVHAFGFAFSRVLLCG
jgi:hypothetical protein